MISKDVEAHPFYREPSVDAEVAAEYIGASVKHVLRLAHNGKIPAHSIGDGMKRHHWRFLLSQLDEWRQARSNSSLVCQSSSSPV